MGRDWLAGTGTRSVAGSRNHPSCGVSESTALSLPLLKYTVTLTVSICGDYKVSINRVVKVDRYPIPNVSGLLTQLACGTMYTTLGMLINMSYWMKNHGDDYKSKGLLEFELLPFGVSSSTGIFQS